MKVKVIGQRSRSPCWKNVIFFKGFFVISLRFDLRFEVKCHMGQGQRSRGSRSNKGSKQRQVGPRQRQVASLCKALTPSLVYPLIIGDLL